MSYIPFGYLEGFLRFIANSHDVIEVLTYRDLDWGGDWDYEAGYPGERRAWMESLRSGRRDPRKIYVFLQHDVDSAPDRTMEALRVEEELGLRSNVMIFSRRIDRRHYRETGELLYTPYIEDRSTLKALEAKGFVVAYHCNAYERSRFSKAEAEQIMTHDVADLSRDFAIDFMSAHGGPPDSAGKSNNSLELPPALSRRIRWVHNGHSIHVDGGFSDGGLNSGRRQADSFDLRRFVQAMRPGGRYRILVHPQYYSDDVDPNPNLRSAWYEEALQAHAARPRRNVWNNTKLNSRSMPGNLKTWKRRIREVMQKMAGR